MTKTNRLEKLQEMLALFAQKRDWKHYHTPKNLAAALSVECSELLEIFQWMTPEESATPDAGTLKHISEEIGDVMIYLCMLAKTFDIDPISAAISKMAVNEKKYPVP